MGLLVGITGAFEVVAAAGGGAGHKLYLGWKSHQLILVFLAQARSKSEGDGLGLQVSSQSVGLMALGSIRAALWQFWHVCLIFSVA